MWNRKAVPTAQQAQSKPEKSAKVTALRHAPRDYDRAKGP